jgi:hypothetical protein
MLVILVVSLEAKVYPAFVAAVRRLIRKNFGAVLAYKLVSTAFLSVGLVSKCSSTCGD